MQNIEPQQQQVQLSTKQSKQIYDIITGKVQPKYTTLDQSIFDVDLVMRIKIPSSKYKSRDKQVPLGQFICNPNQNLSKAYNAAFQDLINQMNQDQEDHIQKNQIMIKDFSSLDYLYPSIIKNMTIKDSDDNSQQIELECKDSYNGNLDAFTIKFNTLIYVLQKKCGFKLRCFIASQKDNRSQKIIRQIYIFISQTIQNLISVAQRHKIKKQIDYTQIDLFINDPTDKSQRPIKINSQAIQSRQRQLKDKFIKIISSKQIIRKLNGVHQKQVPIIDQVQLTSNQLEDYFDYQQQNQKIIKTILDMKIQLSIQEKIYLFQFNRTKINPGVQKQFITIKKKRMYFQQMNKLAKKKGFAIHSPEVIYTQFILASKKMKFFDRVRSLLLYKQKIVSPFGDLSLFVKAERIKICYLALKQYVRIQNLNKLNCQVYALNDNFDKYGKINETMDKRKINPKIRGGLDGKNLAQQWSGIWPWKINLIVLKNYLGQTAAFQIFLKSHLIMHFFVVTPIGVAGQIFSRIYIKDQNVSGNYQAQFYFLLFFYLILSIIYNIFLQLWNQRQYSFMKNYVQDDISHNFLYSYQGPFVRNPITDQINEYLLKSSVGSKIKQFIFFIIIGFILGLQVAFFFGIRQLIIVLDPLFNSGRYYIISPAHLIPYGFFFIGNTILYNYVIKPFNKWMTQKQNLSTQFAFRSSQSDKIFFYLIGLQLIGPIDLLLVQPFNRTDCFANSCYIEFQYYTYCRYLAIFFFVLIKIVRYIFKYFTTNKIEIDFMAQQKYSVSSYYTKFYSLMTFVQEQSNKQQLHLSITDETLALFHHGIFMASFPLSSVFSLLNMMLEYFLQRLEILHNKRRPICKPQKIIQYSSKYYLVMHLSFFVNCWIIFFSLQDIQYAFPQIIQAFQSVPTKQGILTLKILAIVLFIVIFQIIAAIARSLTFSLSGSNIRQRQNNKRNQYLRSKLQNTTKLVIDVDHPYPLRTISRVYHMHPTVLKRKIQTQLHETYKTHKTDGPQMRGSQILRNIVGIKNKKSDKKPNLSPLNQKSKQKSKDYDKDKQKNMKQSPPFGNMVKSKKNK